MNLFIDRAIELSIQNVKSGAGGPFGAVIVQGDRIIAEGANSVTTTNDPTAHAEVCAIRNACAALGRYELEGLDIYTSCEPCPMCLGAIYWSHLSRVFYANTKTDAAQFDFDDSLIYDQLALSPEARKLPMIHIPSANALLAFELWQQTPNKIRY